jgi:hypothetical protein
VRERQATIALTRDRAYDIRLEYYERTGRAAIRLLWSSPSIAKVLVPRSQLYPPTPVRVNFQPGGAAIPSGYLADGGATFGSRGNGHSYGWNVDNSAQARDRQSALAGDQRYDTLTHMQHPANPTAFWEIALPNGTYSVHLVAGDPSYYDGVYRLQAEGVLALGGAPTSTSRWIEGTATVTVSDGRLTIRSATGAVNNKLCFVDIVGLP